jgi:hypothetical protein
MPLILRKNINRPLTIPEMDGNFEFITGSVDTLSGSLNSTNQILIDVSQSVASNTTPYTKYVALLNQTSTSNPIPTILENTLGITPTFTRDGFAGVYSITFPSSLNPAKTYITLYNNLDESGYVTSALIDTLDPFKIAIRTKTNVGLSDDLLINAPLEIRIYP